ncbi:EAL domain-containing protein [Bradyrhizobium japonicum]|uniref:EAL domain-containing protein n=1 Tax=Bradyrhizobium japonicum TaxID=375 RepID=UPI0018AD5AFC|nr:EAL domain-containing protein [Bradyrhizobium japonicum]
MIGLIWAGVVFLSNAEHERAYEAGLRQGSSLTRVFEAYILQVIKGTDSALLAMRDSYEHDPRSFNLMHWVDRAKLQSGLISRFVVIGRDGMMEMSSLAPNGPPIDLRDSDHFHYLAGAKTDELFISPPALGRVSGKTTVRLARKLRAPDGSFNGVIFASLDISQIEKFYNSIDVGHSGTIALVGFDGIIRARSSRGHDAEGLTGRSITGARIFKLYRQSPAGSYWTSPDIAVRMDGVPRLISYRAVEGLPLIVIVGLARQDILGPAAIKISQYRQVGLALTAFVLVVIGFSVVRQRRLTSTMVALERSRHVLEQTNVQFNTALENMAHGLCMFDADQHLIVCNRRYGEMYGLTAKQSAPGTTLRSILEARVAAGQCPEDAEAYVSATLEESKRPQSFNVVNKLRDGRVIAVNHEPMPGGGWVSVHHDITEQHHAKERLDEVRQELIAQRCAIDQAVILAITDVKGRITYANEVFCHISGYSREELIGNDHRILNSGVHPADFFGAMYRQIARGGVWRGEVCNKTKSGSLYWVDTTIVPQLGPDGKPVRYLAIRIDITSRKTAEAALRESQDEVLRKSSQLELALANINQGICLFDANQRVIVANARYGEIYKLTPEEIKPGTTLQEILESRKRQGTSFAIAPDVYRATNVKKVREIQDLADGRTVSISRSVLPDGGWLTSHEDITERRQSEKKVAYLAAHDPLTGLPNRARFISELERITAESGAIGNTAIFLLDLDRFKAVNDTLGHAAGDQLLKDVAARLRSEVREHDIVARLGGDEFAIIQKLDSAVHEPAISLALRIIDAIGRPFELDGHIASVGTSIGIALCPEQGRDGAELMKKADLALYAVKEGGRNDFRIYDAEMTEIVEHQKRLEGELSRAIEREEFELYYQPVLDLKTHRVTGAEALIRWNHPERGVLSPDQFIPLAEETGLIVPLGEWVLQQGCRDAAAWPEDLKIAINLSVHQINCGNLFDVVLCTLVETALSPARLELEITESVLLDNQPEHLQTLRQLRNIGVSIVLDDFGTGYSSSRYLTLHPFDRIKIDKSFVQGMASQRESSAIVASTIVLARGLDISVTAEGVETHEQLRQLSLAGVDFAQGYLIGRPMPLGDFLNERRQSHAEVVA